MEKLQQAILSRNFEFITKYFFDENNDIKDSIKTESELWDFKEGLPSHKRQHDLAWARIAKYVLSFYNARGGVLIFGITNSYQVRKVNSDVDSKLFNDKIRKYISDRIYVDFIAYARDKEGRYLGIAIIPPRGAVLEKFVKDAPRDSNGEQIFFTGWSAIRTGDQSMILNIDEYAKYKAKASSANSNKVYVVDEPLFKILNPEYKNFVFRKKFCEDISHGIRDKRTSIVSITGIGGIGKTALATWAVLDAYNNKMFDFIVSVTAKDRELTQHGISSIFPTMTTFESLLDFIFDALTFHDLKKLSVDEKEKNALILLENSNGLLFIDNLETIEDDRIIRFLDTLPYGVKAVTTSRRNRVKFSVYPITVTKMSEVEVSDYIKQLSYEHGLLYLSTINKAQCLEIAKNIDGIPLAVKWCAKRSSSVTELLTLSEDIKNSGRTSEELLEFSYRRLFNKMSEAEKTILYTLACFNRPVETEVVLFSCKHFSDVEDSLDSLSDDSLIVRTFNDLQKAYEYTLMPLTTNFILSQLKINSLSEKTIRSRIKMYYEAEDISDKNERAFVKLARSGGGQKIQTYIDMAQILIKDGNFELAKDYLIKARDADRSNYTARWRLGELYRHNLNNTAEALNCYSDAAKVIPKNSHDYVVFFREFGLLTLFSQDRDSKTKAEEYFRKALSANYDSRSLAKLATILSEKQQHRVVINIIEQYIDEMSPEDKEHTYPILIYACKQLGEDLKSIKYSAEMQSVLRSAWKSAT